MEARRLIRKRFLYRSLPTKVNVTGAELGTGKRVLKLCSVRVYGTECFVGQRLRLC